ncbi:MAG: alkaline phosphatase family protein [Candidatus Limnocylindria bacterium]
MQPRLTERLRARGFLPPDYDGGSLANVPATVLAALGLGSDRDLPPLRELDPSLTDGVRQVVVVLADGLGVAQLEQLSARGDVPFISSLIGRARDGDEAQLFEATSVFPSTTAAAITTLNTGRTPQEHGNLAYFLWLEEFSQLTQMLRWGRATQRRGSYFDDRSIDPRRFALVSSVHARIRELGGRSYIVEPELFRNEAMTRMHAAAADFVGYVLPSTMGVRIGQLLDQRPWAGAPAYVYAYWAGIDTIAHLHGPRSPEHNAEASLFDRTMERAFGGRPPRDTLAILTADHGHAEVDPRRLIDLEGDHELRALLRAPPAGEPRLGFLHTDRADEVRDLLASRWPGAFTCFDRDEAIAEGLFGRGDATVARRRVGEVCAMLDGDRAATLVRVDGQAVHHRGAHGGMTGDEMRIPVLAWRC